MYSLIIASSILCLDMVTSHIYAAFLKRVLAPHQALFLLNVHFQIASSDLTLIVAPLLGLTSVVDSKFLPHIIAPHFCIFLSL